MKSFTLLAVSLLSLTTFIGCGPTEDEFSPEETLETPVRAMGETDYHCGAGPSAGMSCQVSADCAPYCNAGPDAGLGCTVSGGTNSCTKICTNGPSAGWTCLNHDGCSDFCVGNPATLGTPCSFLPGECGVGGSCTSGNCGGVGCTRPACS